MSKEQVSAEPQSAKVTPVAAVSAAPVVSQVAPVVGDTDENESKISTRPVMKKRVRVRKKATKKVSAAIICANPSIRRFI